MPLGSTFALRSQPQMSAPGMGTTSDNAFSGNANISLSTDVQVTGIVLIALLALVVLSPKVLS